MEFLTHNALRPNIVQNQVMDRLVFKKSETREITPLNTIIIPRSVDALIRIDINLMVECHYYTRFNLYRGDVLLAVPNDWDKHTSIFCPPFEGNIATTPHSLSACFIDEPQTTDPVTYRIEFFLYDIVLNGYAEGATGGAWEVRGASRMILQEL